MRPSKAADDYLYGSTHRTRSSSLPRLALWSVRYRSKCALCGSRRVREEQPFIRPSASGSSELEQADVLIALLPHSCRWGLRSCKAEMHGECQVVASVAP